MTTAPTWPRILIACALLPLALPVLGAGDADRGKKLYRVCAGCHSLEPGRHRAGPSLARVFGRKAGTIDGFMRYSKALKQSNVVWDEKTLDEWIRKPDALIPGNLMPFPGISDSGKREDLVAFLKDVSAKNESGDLPPMRDITGEPRRPDLKQSFPVN